MRVDNFVDTQRMDKVNKEYRTACRGIFLEKDIFLWEIC